MKPTAHKLRLPVVSAGAEYLVKGYLMRRNVLAYQAPTNNEGYDLICVHPNPRHRPLRKQMAQVRVQVKSRYATDCAPIFPLRQESLNAFDFLVIVFLNIGRFYGRNTGSDGREPVEFYTLPRQFVRLHHLAKSSWQTVELGSLSEIQRYRDDAGFEQIAQALGVSKPMKVKCQTKSVG